jgi:hypothetical protein
MTLLDVYEVIYFFIHEEPFLSVKRAGYEK